MIASVIEGVGIQAFVHTLLRVPTDTTSEGLYLFIYLRERERETDRKGSGRRRERISNRL